MLPDGEREAKELNRALDCWDKAEDGEDVDELFHAVVLAQASLLGFLAQPAQLV
jgi:hypothetical protein